MISFESDYTTGAHPEVLKKLQETNLVSVSGYGNDVYCQSAREKIRKAIGMPEADVEFLVGGTQTNAVVISTMLGDHEGVVAAETGHIYSHEAGAVEYTGHKVLTLKQHEGKIDPSELGDLLSSFYDDPSHEHMVFPGMVYISHPTEYGTLYTKDELTELSSICRHCGIPLFMDGARLGYGLMSKETDLALRDIAELCDVFYIGGTKVGALCGEAVVFTRGNKPAHFVTSVKKRGALLAKGRLLGVQFDALFTDDLYFRIGRHAIELAERMKDIFKSHGIPMYLDSPTNQQFAVLDKETAEALRDRIAYTVWEKAGDGKTVARFVTSWSTTEEDLEALDKALAVR